MNKTRKDDQRREWKAHWPMVVCCFLGFGFYSIVPNALGLFVEPLTTEFGWSRTEIMTGLSISAVTSIFLSPFVGGLIDHWGSRRIALPGLVLSGVVLASFGLANGSAVQWMMFWVCQSLVFLLIKATVWTTAVSGTFYAGRSLAIAVTMCGTAFAQAIVPPLTQWLIAAFGWRHAYFLLGFGWGGIALIPAIFFLYDARDRLRKSDNDVHTVIVKDNPKQPELPGLTLREAIRHPALIRICIATFIVMLTGIGILVNQVPILVESGVTREYAAYLTSIYGVSGIFGKLATGWLMDRFEAGWVGGITLGLSGFAFLLMLKQVDSIPMIIIGLMVIGYAAGTKLQICAYLTSLYGGLRNFGKIFGIMSSAIAVGGGVGPALAALVYDMTGSYSLFIYAACILSLVAAYLLFGLGPAPKEFVPAPVVNRQDGTSSIPKEGALEK
ncbi:MFS transporter [Aestuariicella hydrocarbonica]|uniref:MFS transporter n=1 Tax=Pseudomaricurvus hydrocarbonicus TaxID=1470433 RepID=A0A9E5JW49_9GAMM|nr:MFS transporter [Aestuariicella hydrocarbonica]NHO65666.1 MFS transporter [Aestuariicella hydrocarbonica]